MSETDTTAQSSCWQNPWFRAAVGTAAVSGAFVLIVASFMLYFYITKTIHDPLDNPQLQQALQAVSEDKDNADKRQLFRVYDVAVQQQFWQPKALLARGGVLLTIGGGVLLLSLHAVNKLRKRPPQPGTSPTCAGMDSRQATFARWSMGGVVAALVGAMVAVPLLGDWFQPTDALRDVDEAIAALEESRKSGRQRRQAEAAGPVAVEADPNARWERFRGMDGQAVYAGAAPTTWGGAEGENVRWQAELPLPGDSSPVVWGDYVLLTGADEETREIYCYDAASGELRWKQEISTPQGEAAGAPEPVWDETEYAASTVATDGKYIFAIFANGEVGCVDFTGKVIWAKHLGMPENAYGYSSSPVVHEDRVLIQWDQTSEENSAMIALNKETGDELWQTDRPVRQSWATPIIAETDSGPQLVTVGNPWAIAYEPASGEEIWRAKVLDGEVTPSPIFAGGHVIVCSGRGGLVAIRPDGEGDVTESHVAWRQRRFAPDVASPVSDGERVYTVNAGGRRGLVLSYGIEDGEMVWRERISGKVWASPAIAGGKLYILADDGSSIIMATGETAEQLATPGIESEGEAKFEASPAFAAGRMYLRSDTTLYCIGSD
ncbi:MAG: PQQ-binding-like beta-propeller repeat protein [Planctomycetota bacterium]